MVKLKCFFSFLILVLVSSTVGASVWQVNKDHSEIFFQIPYLTVSEVTGRFTKFSGTVEVDDSTQKPQSVFIRIDAASIDTGNRLRDGHLRSGEFLKAEKNPYLTFDSSSISEVKGHGSRAYGVLTIAGVSKKTSIDFSLSSPVRDTWKYQSMFAKFTAVIDRRDFDIVWNKTLQGEQYLLGNALKIWGTIQIQPHVGVTPSSKHMIPDTTYIREREKLLRGEVESVPQTRPVVTPAAPVNHVPMVAAPHVEEKVSDVRDRFTWQVSFWVLGLFGFIASIMLGLLSKKVVIDRFSPEHSEGGMMGIATDSITIVLVLIYAIAFWEVGWGR